jgi:hypothetical protein
LLKRDDPNCGAQQIDLRLRQAAAAALHESTRERSKHVQAQLDALQVRLVLLTPRHRRPAQVAKIIQRSALHRGVEVDDALEGQNPALQEHVADLRIVVADAAGDEAAANGLEPDLGTELRGCMEQPAHGFNQCTCSGTALANEGDVGLCRVQAFGLRAGVDGVLKHGEAAGRVVEAGNSVCKTAREGAHAGGKMAEGCGDGGRELGAGDDLQRHRVFNITRAAPVCTGGVDEMVRREDKGGGGGGGGGGDGGDDLERDGGWGFVLRLLQVSANGSNVITHTARLLKRIINCRKHK